jgi:hypothetical protein
MIGANSLRSRVRGKCESFWINPVMGGLQASAKRRQLTIHVGEESS